MTLAAIKSTGRGKLELRLAFEGLGYEAVTSAAMEKTTADGRQRVRGLSRAGITYGEDVDLAHADMEASGFVAKITDRQSDSAWTKALAWRPSVRTYLDADLTRTGTTVTVLSTSGMTSGDVIHAGTEAILIGTVASGTSLTGCTRGYWDTIQQAHYASARGDATLQLVTLSRPMTLEGRRAYLYGYGEGDDLTGDGTQLWIGIASTDAHLSEDGSDWSVTLDPIWSLLNQPLGADLDEPVPPRGIYYSSHNPLVLYIREGSTTTAVSGASNGAVIRIPEDIAEAFFESNADLCDAINAEFAANADVTALNNTYRAVAVGDDDWYLECTVSSGTPKWPIVGYISRTDGAGGNAQSDLGGAHASSLVDLSTGAVLSGSVSGGESVRTVPGAEWVPGSRTVPRGYWGKSSPAGWDRVGYYRGGTAGDAATYPPWRVYLGGALSVSGLDGVEIQFASGFAVSLEVDAQDASDRYIDTIRWRPGSSAGGGASHADFAYTRDWMPEIRFKRFYAIGDLADFRDALVSTTDGSPIYANLGAMPFVTATDLASWTTEVDAAHRDRYWAAVRYFVAYESVKLDEFVSHHLMMLGLFPSVNSSGQIAVKPIRTPAPTETPDATISYDALIDVTPPTWERNALGSINQVLFRTGYDSRTDEHIGTTYRVPDRAAQALRKKPLELEIAPKSEPGPLMSGSIPSRDIYDLVRPIFGMFAGDHELIQIEVPLKYIDTLVGDVVHLSTGALPDTKTGTRGMSARPAIVIGREWDLDGARGRLRLLASGRNVAGYTPTLTVSSAAEVSDPTWDLTVTSMDPQNVRDWFASGDALSARFVAGDRVVEKAWDSLSAYSQEGTVVSVTDSGTGPATGVIRVTFDSGYEGSAGDILAFDVAGEATATQDDYAYLAGDDAVIDFATAVSAVEYGS